MFLCAKYAWLYTIQLLNGTKICSCRLLASSTSPNDYKHPTNCMVCFLLLDQVMKLQWVQALIVLNMHGYTRNLQFMHACILNSNRHAGDEFGYWKATALDMETYTGMCIYAISISEQVHIILYEAEVVSAVDCDHINKPFRNPIHTTSIQKHPLTTSYLWYTRVQLSSKYAQCLCSCCDQAVVLIDEPHWQPCCSSATMHTCTTIDSQNWSVVNVTSRAAIHKLHYDLWDRRNYETPSISAVNYSSSYMLVSYCHHRGIIPLINIINNLYAVYFWIFTVWWDDYFIFRRHMWVLKCKLFDLLEWTGIRWTTLTCSKRVCIITVKCTSYTRYSIIIASNLYTHYSL